MNTNILAIIRYSRLRLCPHKRRILSKLTGYTLFVGTQTAARYIDNNNKVDNENAN